MGSLVPKILGWLTIVITLALAPTINTYNTYVTGNVTAAVNSAKMIGMTAVDDFAAPIMIITMLFVGGMIAAGKVGDGTIRGILDSIGVVVVAIISLSMFSGSIISYVDTLITASSGFAQTIYGVIPIILYVGIIAGAGAYTVYKSFKGGKKKTAKAYY